MNLSEVKKILPQLKTLEFQLPNGNFVPEHFHVTEVGLIKKHFIDCGGTIRNENVISFQLWEATDYDHRLAPQKLLNIIELSERLLELPDAKIEVEYQAQTIGKYGLEYNGNNFVLTNTKTDCLAKDKCGIPQQKPKIKLSELQSGNTSCSPGSGCCN